MKWTLESACSTSRTDRLAPSMCSQPMKLPALSMLSTSTSTWKQKTGYVCQLMGTFLQVRGLRTAPRSLLYSFYVAEAARTREVLSECTVDMGTAMSRTPVPLPHGSGKTFPSEALRDGKTFLSQSVNADRVQKISTVTFSPPILIA